MDEPIEMKIGELIEPDPIGFGFGAPGWTILVAILFMGVVVYGIVLLLRYQRNKYRREAITFLQLVSSSPDNNNQKLYKLAETLKRVALLSYGRVQQAGLYGTPWLNYLAERNKGKRVFSQDIEVAYIQSLYKGKLAEVNQVELDSMYAEGMYWIKSHHV